MKWLILTYPYTDKSNGIKIMHNMVNMLNVLGEEAYISFIQPNQDYTEFKIFSSADKKFHNENLKTTPLNNSVYNKNFKDEAIVLYPEVVTKNILNAKKIVRWYGNRPGNCSNGTKLVLDPNTYILSHSKILLENANAILFNSSIDNFFYDQREHNPKDRVLDLVYHGKGILTAACDTFENTFYIDRYWPKDRRQLAYLLKQCRYFYTYDSMTNLNAEAVAAGAVPVFLRYDPWKEEEIDSMECGKFPRGELLEIKDNKVYATVNIEKFNEERKNFLNKVEYYEKTWDNRFKETVEQIKQYFS